MTLKSREGKVLLDMSHVILYVFIGISVLIWLLLLAPVSYFFPTDFAEYLKGSVPECTSDGDYHLLGITWISLGITLLWLVTIPLLVAPTLSYIARYIRYRFPERNVNINGIQLVIWLLIVLILLLTGLYGVLLLTAFLFLGTCVWSYFFASHVQPMRKQSMYFSGVLLVISLASIPRWLSIMDLAAKLQEYCESQV